MPNNESNKNNRRAVKTADNTYAKVQPQDLNAERALLGGLLIDNRAWDRVCDMLRPESFYEPRNQIVYGTIRNMYMDGKKVDIITLSDRLAKNGNIDEIGGPGVYRRIKFNGRFLCEHRRICRNYCRKGLGSQSYLCCQCH